MVWGRNVPDSTEAYYAVTNATALAYGRDPTTQEVLVGNALCKKVKFQSPSPRQVFKL